MMLLKVNNLSVSLRSTKEALVHNSNFSLESSQSLVILGESGSGKTLTCKTLMGILNHREFIPGGKALFNGEDLLTMPPKALRQIYGGQIAMIPQNPMTALNPSRRIGGQMVETLRLHRDLRKKEAEERCHAALKEAGLKEHERVFRSFPFMLSGGMLQRVIIAMALMVSAKLIVADEPTTALDAEHRGETVDTLIRLRERGAAILLVTHDFAAAIRLGGKLLIMKDGYVLESGDAKEILRNPSHPYTKELISGSRLYRDTEELIEAAV